MAAHMNWGLYIIDAELQKKNHCYRMASYQAENSSKALKNI